MGKTYTRVGLAHSLEQTNVEGMNTRSSQFLLIHVQPQVVGSVASQVVLVTIEIKVPHFILLINYILLFNIEKITWIINHTRNSIVQELLPTDWR